MADYTFDAYVTAALFDRDGRALFALGDGTVRFEDGTVAQAHPDATSAPVTSAPAVPMAPATLAHERGDQSKRGRS